MLRKAAANHHVVLWGFCILSFLLRCYDLSAQPATDDDAGMASSATNYLLSGMFGQIMQYHPPLRNLLVYLSGKIFGAYSAWGLKGPAVLTGSLTVPVVGYLAYSLFGNKRIAYLSAFFLCVDPLHINASRQVIQEASTTFFISLGILASVHGIRKDRIVWLYLSGAFFGLAAASKWHGLFPWAVSAGAYLAYPYFKPLAEGGRYPLARILTFTAAYVAIPIAVYTAAYIPWFDRGHSLAEFLGLQLSLVKYQYLHKGTEYNEFMVPKRAYQWFLRPVPWFDFAFVQGRASVGIAMGNFLVWGLTLPSLYYCIRTWIREKRFELGYVIALFLAAYLPMVLTTRGIWVLLATPTILLAFILSAYALSGLIDAGRISRRLLASYVVVVVMLSAVMYPMSIFKALDYPWTKALAELYTPHRGEVK